MVPAKSTDGGPAYKRIVVERLLAWGFSPATIAEQLHCSRSWVYIVRKRIRARPR